MGWSFQKRPEGKTKTLHTPHLERILARRDEWMVRSCMEDFDKTCPNSMRII
jgi:hypothetical protein